MADAASNTACSGVERPDETDSIIDSKISSVAAAFGSAHEREMSADCTNTAEAAEADVSVLTSRRTGGKPSACATAAAAVAVVSFCATVSAPPASEALRFYTDLAPRATAKPCISPEVI